jgi:hypothetical protein
MKSVQIFVDVALTKRELIKLVWDPEVALRLVYVIQDLRKIDNTKYLLNKKYEVTKIVWPDNKVVYTVLKKNGKMIDELSFNYYGYLWYERSLLEIAFKTNRFLVSKNLISSTIISNARLLFNGIYASKEIDGIRRILDFRIR